MGKGTQDALSLAEKTEMIWGSDCVHLVVMLLALGGETVRVSLLLAVLDPPSASLLRTLEPCLLPPVTHR